MNIYEQFNIIERDEEFIGTVENLKLFFLQVIHDNTEKVIDFESLVYEIDEIIDLLKTIIEDYEDNDKLIVKYNPMGAFYAELYTEE